MNLSLDGPAAPRAVLRRDDFFLRHTEQRIPAGARHSERPEEIFLSEFLKRLSRNPGKHHSEKDARRIPVIEYGARFLRKLIRKKCLQDSLRRELLERTHRHAVIEAVRKQMTDKNFFAIVCIQFRQVIADACVQGWLSLQYEHKRERGRRADLGERSDVEHGIFRRAESEYLLRTVRHKEPGDGL